LQELIGGSKDIGAWELDAPESAISNRRSRRCDVRRQMLIVIVLLMIFGSATLAEEYYVKHKGEKKKAVPTESTGLVYVFRPATMGAAIKTWTFADDQLIGVSKAKGYYFAELPAGKHLIWSKAENTSALEVDIEAGHTYYFKTAIKMGFGKARVKLVAVTAEEAEKFFAKCSFCEPTEEGRQRATEIAANRIDAAKESADQRAAKEGDPD
jgi:hypothetical protein